MSSEGTVLCDEMSSEQALSRIQKICANKLLQTTKAEPDQRDIFVGRNIGTRPHYILKKIERTNYCKRRKSRTTKHLETRIRVAICAPENPLPNVWCAASHMPSPIL